jgi:uncharacterized protein (UPF0210 family)
MQIRTITAGAREADVERAAHAAQVARERLIAAGYMVQTLRLALTATGSNRCGDFATIAQAAEEQAIAVGFDCVSIGVVDGDRLAALHEAIGATESLFASAQIVGADGGIRHETIHAAAQAIAAIGASTPDGLGNLRFTASACVAPGSPFFPAAYHDGGAPWIAIGPEAAALAIAATADGKAAAFARGETQSQANVASTHASVLRPIADLTALIEHHDSRITRALQSLEPETGVRFAGCDWSLTPYPDPTRSVGAAIEALSEVPFGAWGTLAAVRTLTSAIRTARVTQLGFSGVMLSVLEDTTLARRNAQGRYTLRDLLAFSAVCGTGLDTIPLPGDTTPEQIAGVLTEVAALATALRKPLTARLVPLPGLQAGDWMRFDQVSDPRVAEYFCASRVMRIQ